MSQFAFLHTGWPDLHDAAGKAELLVYSDARVTCFHAWHSFELAVHWLYEFPFTDLDSKGPEGVFESAQVDEFVTLLGEVQSHALAFA